MFALAIPLAAGLSMGCKPDICQSHNETSITLNRQTDGKSMSVKDFEEGNKGVPPTHLIIDFINETHALATEGLPDNVVLTVVPERCSSKFHDAPAYAVNKNGITTDGLTCDRGVYVVKNYNALAIPLLNTLNHEIGHLQQGNHQLNEVVSQLNPYEQLLMGFVLLNNQDAGEDLIRYIYHMETWAPSKDVANTLDHIIEGKDTLSTLTEYRKTEFYLYKKLIETGGDFASVREGLKSLSDRRDLVGTVDAFAPSFIQDHIDVSHTNILTDLRIAYFRELERRFGNRTARAYLKATSALLNGDPVFGLGKASCADQIFSDIPPNPVTCLNDPECEVIIGADKKAEVSMELCCLEVDEEGTLSKHSVSAEGTTFINFDRELMYYGFGWRMVRFLQVNSKEELPLDEPCP